MYFITALVCTLVSGLLWFFFRERKLLHLDILTITYGAASMSSSQPLAEKLHLNLEQPMVGSPYGQSLEVSPSG